MQVCRTCPVKTGSHSGKSGLQFQCTVYVLVCQHVGGHLHDYINSVVDVSHRRHQPFRVDRSPCKLG